MTRQELIITTVVDTVPQWYLNNVGQHVYSLTLRGTTLRFCSHRALTPQLDDLYMFICRNLRRWESQLPPIPTPSAISQIRADIALEWLRAQDNTVEWNKLIAYAEGLLYRTYENSSVTLNLVIGGDGGGTDITRPDIQKILDPLAAVQQVYFRIDKQLRFLQYNEILWQNIHDSQDYKFNPEFLQPFASILAEGEFSLHLTTRSDITILDRWGLVAARRKGNWYVYDNATFKNSIADIVGHYRVGCNLFEIVFDLSYRRRGALLVYDPQHQVINHVSNPASVISGPNADAARAMLASSIRPIRMSATNHPPRKKRVFLEIAGTDGAVIFDDNHVLAFGAMIEPHPQVGSHSGARTTAAHSAYRWGSFPIKVSSDGDVTVLFRSRDPQGNLADAQLHFM
jgi:hypothetical protein